MNKWLKFITAIFFSFSFCLACVGYAAISDNLYIEGTLEATPQEGVYITDYKYISNDDAIVGSSEITYAYQTMLNSTIALSKTNEDSSITYEITIYNSNDFDTAFNGVKYLKYDGTVGTYSNENITYSLTGLDERQILKSKQYVTFQITFTYIDNLPDSYSNVLESVINFQYPRIYYVTYENFESTAGYPGIAFVEQDLTVSLGSITEPVQVTKKTSGSLLYEENYDDTITVDKSNINDNIHLRRMTQYSLSNIIYNSSFETGNHNGWGGSGGASNLTSQTPVVSGGYYSSYRVVRYPNEEGANFLTHNVGLKANHKYYYFLYAMTDSDVTQPFKCNVEGIADSLIDISLTTKYQRVDSFFTSPSTATYSLNANWGHTTGNTFMDAFCFIDLTAAFGAGNEPDIEWCRSHITYFAKESSTSDENYLYLYK